MIKLLFFITGFYCFEVFSAELSVVDYNDKVLFLIIESENDNFEVDSHSFVLNSGLKVSVERGGKLFSMSASDFHRIGFGKIELKQGAVLGRVFSKQFLSIYYHISEPGNYSFTANICDVKNKCISSLASVVSFTLKDIPL